MRALIMMLFNTALKTYHPILYFENPFPGNPDNNIFRFKSKGHRTIGFLDRNDALLSIETEIVARLEGYKIYKDLECDMLWDGEGIPADNQLRGSDLIK